MLQTKTMADAENKTAKLVAVILPLVVIAITLLVWFIQPTVTSVHATKFLLHEDPAIGFLFIAASVWLVIVVIGVLKQTDLITTNLWPHILLGILAFACWYSIGTTRYNCSEDVNVSARYNAFAAEKGWDK